MKDIGQIIKKVANSHGLNQTQVGQKIGRTKQGVASIYKRDTIDTDLLVNISDKLNHDFLSYYYEEEPMSAFKKIEIDKWESKITALEAIIVIKDENLRDRKELVETQRKLIEELYAKLARTDNS
jgi:transcriptional regulator with XRE-family HTH domain